MNENNETIILTGKTASGKTTIAKILEKMGYTRIVTDTTRPIRKGEQDGVDYHFRTLEEFKNLENSGYFAETMTYNASFGICSYGSRKKSYETKGKSVIVLNPYAVKQIRKNIKRDKYVSIYLNVDENILTERLHNRGDSEEEIIRRVAIDHEDFADMSEICDFTIYIRGSDTPEEIADRVLSVIKQNRSGINLAFCIDEKKGMMFNNRRQSQDAVLREKMLQLANDMGGSIYMNAYTAKQFSKENNIKIYNEPWKHASPSDIVFIEDIDPANLNCDIRSLIIYKWNRSYPWDVACTLDFDDYKISNIRNFSGKSHEIISEEIYTK